MDHREKHCRSFPILKKHSLLIRNLGSHLANNLIGRCQQVWKEPVVAHFLLAGPQDSKSVQSEMDGMAGSRHSQGNIYILISIESWCNHAL